MKRLLLAPILLSGCVVGPPFTIDTSMGDVGGDAGASLPDVAPQMTSNVASSPDAGRDSQGAFDALGSVLETSNDAGLLDAGPDVQADAGNEGGICALVTHNNGQGQFWGDCTPVATYTLGEAMSACLAFANATPGALACKSTDATMACGVSFVLTSVSAGAGTYQDYTWIYAADPGGIGIAGDTFAYNTAALSSHCKGWGTPGRWQ